MAEKDVRPASEEQQEEYNDLIEKNTDKVKIAGTEKEYEIGWMCRGTIRKISDIMSKDSSINDDKMSSKLSAAIILNGKWSIMFRYWFLWRWFYYVKQYGDEQLRPIVELGKKKVPQIQYYKLTISAIEMRDTIKTMTKKEVEHFRQGLSGAQDSH